MGGCGKGGLVHGKEGKISYKILKDLKENIKPAIKSVSRHAIKRLARRGGVDRLCRLSYKEARKVLKMFLEQVIKDTIIYTEHANRKTISAVDVVYGLKKQGYTLYGSDVY